MPIEIQQSISQWVEETFGPAGSNLRCATRANEKMAELLKALSTDENHSKACEEAADVVIVLMRLATRMGIDLDSEIRDIVLSPDESQWTTLRRATGANEELSRGVRRLADNDIHPYASESVAMVCLLMDRLVRAMGGDLGCEIDRKMITNRARSWKSDGTGQGYHIPNK